jgi:RimJ/RimL family protein N-acetyltransferase
LKDFHPNNHYSIENEVVLLRPLKLDDFEHLLPFAIHEPDLWKYSLIPANGEKNLKLYLKKAISDQNNLTTLPFIVFDKRTEEYAGSTRFYDIQTTHATTQLGYTWFGKKFHGTGLNQNCKYLMLDFAFNIMKVERIEFRADANNTKSITSMKNIGCKEEGILRSNCTSPSDRRDSIVLSILKSEWQQEIKTQLYRKISF